MTPDPRLARLSLNQMTIQQWSVHEAVDGCARKGVPAIGLWREPIQEIGVAAAAKLVADAGLRVSSLCRGGFLTAEDPLDRTRALEDNRRALDEAAELGARCLVIVAGGLPSGSRDLAGARGRLAEGIAVLAPEAAACGVPLALEPLHPMYCADRAVLSTLGQALDLAERFSPAEVGVVVDAFHVWWDADVWQQIARAGERILSFQVCDWITPLPPDALLARGMMGDGHIDLHALREAVDEAGYADDIEVEIFNATLWAADGERVLDKTIGSYLDHVAPAELAGDVGGRA